jgi:pimeloyl-ACP methyl ester carboxylesterase
MQTPKPKRWEILSWIPIAVGLYWLLARNDGHWLIWALLPGSVLLSTGVSLLLMPGDPRITAYMALASVVGVTFALILFVVGNVGPALVCLIGSAGCFLVAGRVGLTAEALDPDAPLPEMSLEMDAKAGLDEALLGYFVAGIRSPAGDEAAQMCEDAIKLEAIIKEHGWDAEPSRFHQPPPPPVNVGIEKKRIYGYDYEELRWDSGFLPDDALPGATLWKRHTANNQCTVRVLRHPGPARPWLLCVHGYRMGAPWMDLGMFHPRWLHRRLGLNIVQPVLPLHGPRRIGARSGDYFLDGNLIDLIYAEAQALWDLRRTVAWIREQEPQARIGVFGVSLGGYNASLLANYEPGLEFVVAGIPVVDFAAALWRFMPPAYLRYFVANGLDENRYREILKLVSPLQRAPLLERDRLLIFAAAGDRIVLPQHPIKLSRHWGVPISWYQGSHLTLRSEPETRETLREAMLRASWPAVG